MTFFTLYDIIIIMKEIIKLLNDNGYEAFVVGGFVRDYLLGKSSFDIDISTNAPINKIMKIFKGRGKAFKEYFSYHIEENGYTYNITTYRKEGKYKRNKPVEVTVANDLGTDLLRRDFTINTFAIDAEFRLVDILGARKDLNSRLIKVVGDTDKKLTEDKTRIVRAIRFACTLDFDLSPEIVDFISKNGHYINEVPKEYKKKEMDLIFDSANAYKYFFIVKRYNLQKYFNIKFDKVIPTYNRYGIWSQVETELPFSKKEESIISHIKEIVNRKDVYLSDVRMYNDDIVINAAGILGREKKVKTYKEILDLHSIVDIDINPDVFLDCCKLENIKKTYKLVEKNIIEGKLENNSKDIEEFIRNLVI